MKPPAPVTHTSGSPAGMAMLDIVDQSLPLIAEPSIYVYLVRASSDTVTSAS
jgi:hypothetical protein